MLRLPALTLWRPWPHLILHNGKNVENRPWAPTYRGDLLIHAGQKWDGPRAFNTAVAAFAAGGLKGRTTPGRPEEHPLGIVGVVYYAGPCTASKEGRDCDCGPWKFDGQCHLDFRDPQPFAEPIPHRGALGLWQVDDAVWPQVQAQLEEVNRG